MEYKIGEFARMLGVSADTLRHYGRSGLLSPKVNPRNGYRYYTDRDALRLFYIRMYRGLDMSIPEIYHRMQKESMEEEAAWTWAEISRVDKEIMRLQHLRYSYTNRLDAIERARSMTEEITEIRLPPAYQLYYEELSDYSSSVVEPMMRAWTKGMPFVGPMFLLERKEIESDAPPQPKLGLGARLRHVEEFDLPIGPPVRMMSGGPGIRRQFTTKDPFSVERKELKPVLAYLKAKNCAMDGDVVYMIDAVDYRPDGPLYYIDLHLQIKAIG